MYESWFDFKEDPIDYRAFEIITLKFQQCCSFNIFLVSRK